MPVYEYACTVCGHTVEVIHGINAAGPARCDECGGALRKLLSPPAIVFKGSGWAKKDARGSSSSAGASHSGGGAAKRAPGGAPAGAGSSGAPATPTGATGGASGAGD